MSNSSSNLWISPVHSLGCADTAPVPLSVALSPRSGWVLNVYNVAHVSLVRFMVCDEFTVWLWAQPHVGMTQYMSGVYVLQKSTITGRMCWAVFGQVADEWGLKAAGLTGICHHRRVRLPLQPWCLQPWCGGQSCWGGVEEAETRFCVWSHVRNVSVFGVAGVCVLMTMWRFFCFRRNLILNVILLLSGFLVDIKFKLSKQILVLTVMLCALLIQWTAWPRCPE